jgi:DNA-binding transcriptional MerR regulator
VKIGELAKRSGLAASTIRFYESKGLLKPVPRQINGYREYAPEALLLLGIITGAQQAGFSLDEIRQVLPPDLASWQHDELLNTLEKKIADIEAMEHKLRASKMQLRALVQRIQNKPEGMDCADNARRVLDDMLDEVPQK